MGKYTDQLRCIIDLKMHIVHKTIHRVIRKYSKLSLPTHLMLDPSFEVQVLGSLESFLHQIWIPIMGWGQIQGTWFLGA